LRVDAQGNGFDLLQVHTPVRRLLHAPVSSGVPDLGQIAA